MIRNNFVAVRTGGGRLGTAAKFCSFAGATLVLMADGTKKPIRDIRVGDQVVATDPETDEQVAKTVEHVWKHEDTVTDLVVDGEVISTTEDHPFWNATDGEFQRADQLDTGDQVRAADGRLVSVSGLRLGTARTDVACNVEVEGIHTYHVGSAELLVHNACRDIPANGASAKIDDVLDMADDWPGSGYSAPVCGSGRYVSADGTRVSRMGQSDITGAHVGDLTSTLNVWFPILRGLDAGWSMKIPTYTCWTGERWSRLN